jgi:hypothetical protein
MQVKLNELLAAVQKATPTLINLEVRLRARSRRSMTGSRSCGRGKTAAGRSTTCERIEGEADDDKVGELNSVKSCLPRYSQ